MDIDGYFRERLGEAESRVLMFIDGFINTKKYDHFLISGASLTQILYSGRFTTDVPKQVQGDFGLALGQALNCMEDGEETAALFSNVKDRRVEGSALHISKHPDTELYKATYVMNFASGYIPVAHQAYVGRPNELADLLD